MKHKNNNLVTNRSIRNKTIRVVEDFAGVYTLDEALQIANNEGLDLIEISNQPERNTSICKIMEVGKFLYQQKKKEKEKAKNSHQTEIKEVRLSADISQNDISYRVKNCIEFLKEGNKVKCTMLFRGREILFKDKGELVMLEFANALQEVGVLESMPKLEGKKLSCILKPKKAS